MTSIPSKETDGTEMMFEVMEAVSSLTLVPASLKKWSEENPAGFAMVRPFISKVPSVIPRCTSSTVVVVCVA